MSYNPNIPLSTDIPSQSQAQILANFSQLNTQFTVDHVALNAGSNNGYHKQITYQNVLGSDPNLVSPISSLYTKTASGLTQLFFQNGSLASNVAQLTGLTVTTVANGGSAGGNIIYFDTPWNMRIYMGQTASIPSPAARVVTFPTSYSTIYTSSAVANDPNAIAVACAQSTNQLSIRTAAAVTVNWFAIGTL